MPGRAEKALRRAGLEVGRPGGRFSSIRLRRMTIPQDLPSRGIRRNRPVTVPIRRIVTSFGFSYADDGWHPYWEAAEALLSTPDLAPEASPLTEFYARFQPRTALEALFPEGGDLPPLDRVPARYTPVLWTSSRRQLENVVRSPRTRTRNMNFGPATLEYIQATHEQLRSILDSVTLHGYRPHEFAGGIIEGFFLIRDADYRFVPTEGQHRLGPLRALGVEEVPALPRFGLSGVVNTRLEQWTTQQAGPYRPDVAQRLLDRYFEVRPCPWPRPEPLPDRAAPDPEQGGR